jgi:hypothetical protein
VADKDPNVDSRLSRLETIIDAISDAVNKIEEKLDGQSKINWAPIAIGVTVFFTVAGSVSTIYNARISTINTAVEQMANRTLELEKGAVVGKLTDEVSSEKIMRLEKDVEDIDNRVEELEKH